MKFSAACMENLEKTRELPKQSLLTGKKIFSKNGATNQEVAMSYDQCLTESRIDRSLNPLPCKTPKSTLLRPKTPCKFIWYRIYLRLVATKIF